MPLKTPCFIAPRKRAIPLHLIDQQSAADWLKTRPKAHQNIAKHADWSAQLGQLLVFYDGEGAPECAVIGYGDSAARARLRFGALARVHALPKGVYALQDTEKEIDRTAFALGWALSKYRFDRYKSKPAFEAELCVPKGVDTQSIEAMAIGESLTRDLINTPASDMGPAALQSATCDIAQRFGADVRSIVGADLLTQNFPMIHAVGRAAAQAPRLIEMNWGSEGPSVTLVGKGVCFDTGGLNIKPGNSMGLMKKDMGGAAHVLGLAQMIMATQKKLRLRVLIPAVENAISGNAYRPQDVLTSRAGLTVEVNNTDAEGRLVLADALALANETPPDLLICMATLTGAARVAVGPDIAPFFTDQAALATSLHQSAQKMQDPIWQLPFHTPYEKMIEPDVADLDNAPAGGFAGAITAALFLRRFVPDVPNFIHFDCYGWQPIAAPARPKGGAAQGIRTLFMALPTIIKETNS